MTLRDWLTELFWALANYGLAALHVAREMVRQAVIA